MGRIRFVLESFVIGAQQLSRLYGKWVTITAALVLLAGVSLPPVFNWLPLHVTLPLGVILFALVALEGAYRKWDAAQRWVEKLDAEGATQPAGRGVTINAHHNANYGGNFISAPVTLPRGPGPPRDSRS
jgi:hypothetical protein